ncbi:MAG: cation transporter, partial [Actinobacteria bacterium]|nr:cation transporter [Actinomycetota bacterium]
MKDVTSASDSPASDGPARDSPARDLVASHPSGRRASSTASFADPARQDGEDGGGGESTVTVLLALGANAGVGLLKLAAGLITGSGALLSEAAHSAGDSSTELLLLTALRRSERPADRVHPFGYGKERYFWSLLAAISIFTAGA